MVDLAFHIPSFVVGAVVGAAVIVFLVTLYVALD
jgi:hypothetical protein